MEMEIIPVDPGTPERMATVADVLTRHFSLQKDAAAKQEQIMTEAARGAREVSLGLAPKASRVFLFTDGSAEMGASEVGIYSWKRLGNQLVFNRDSDSIWLSKMNRVLPGLDPGELAVEFAYFAVENAYRGMGLGSVLFKQSLCRVLEEVGPVECLFTIAKGVYSGSGKGQQVKEHLLGVERQINGIDENGLTIVKGVKVPLGLIEDEFHIGRQDLRVRPESVATVKLAQRMGWQEIGLATNLSPIYGTRVDNMPSVFAQLQ